MKVLLKKTKITLSVINQLPLAREESVRTYTVLGWVLLRFKNSGFRKILLHDSESNTLVCMNYPVKIEDKIQGQDHRFDLYYKNDFGNNTYYSFDTKEKCVQFHSVLDRVTSEAKEKGQIFY
jgi:hypothetical protein